MTWGTQAAQSLAEALGSWFSGSSTDPGIGAPAAAGVAAAVAAVDASGTFVATSPSDLPEGGRFELGSVTKTMTATVLAALAAEGILSLDDPVSRWLSAGQNGQITIRQLATHSSGLPAVAPNWQHAQGNPANPWAGYTFERAEEGLRQATRANGSPWRYSNLGYHLLGLILQRASGTEYPVLMTERLLAPLAMTRSGLGQRGEGTLLPGHAADHQAPRWDHPWGAGGIEATITDLARYTRACLFHPDTPLGAAIRFTQVPVLPRQETPHEPHEPWPPGRNRTWQALAWAVEDKTLRWHTGGTGGFSSCVMIDHRQGRAIAALISYGGSPACASRLKQIAQLTLTGADPRQDTGPEPWPSWRQDAKDDIRALLAGDIARVHARLAPRRREKISVQQLGNAWTKTMPLPAQRADIAIVHHEIAASGTVVAHIAVTTPDDSRRLRIVILPTGELGGFSPVPAS